MTVVVFRASGVAAGCGDGSAALDCEHVLSSRWSKWLGLPVSAPAVGLYLTAALAVMLIGPRFSAPLRRIAWSLLLALAVTAAGAALWFVALQIWVVEDLCPYCMTVHGCGIILAGLVTWGFISLPRGGDESTDRGATMGALAGTMDESDWTAEAINPGRPSSIPALLAAAAVLATLVVGQLIVRPASHATVEHFEHFEPPDSFGPSETTTVPPAGETNVDGESPSQPPRLMWLLGGKTFIDLNQHIILGSADAEIVTVKLFDYTCKHCRLMHRHLEAAREHFGQRLAIVLAPVPLERSCNRLIQQDSPHHKNACLYAHLATAVWWHKRERFEEFHTWLMAGEKPPSPDKARKFASEILGAEGASAALVDRKITLHIGKCVDLWPAAREKDKPNGLPQRLFASSIIHRETATAEELIKKIEGIANKARQQKESAKRGESP